MWLTRRGCKIFLLVRNGATMRRILVVMAMVRMVVHRALVGAGFLFHLRFDRLFFGGREFRQMAHPKGEVPDIVGRVLFSEPRHPGVADSFRDDEIELGVGKLLHIFGKLHHRRMKVRFELVSGTTVEGMTSG